MKIVPYRLRSKPRPAAAADGVVVQGDSFLNVADVQAFAREFRDKHRGLWTEVDHLGGFCLLIKRESASAPWKARPPWRSFDTDALCQKARQAGFALACCRDLFIHHFASRTFDHGGPAR